MPVSEVSVNSRIEALRAKHHALSKEVDDAYKNLSTTDFQLSQLKKQKLVVKENIENEEKRRAG
ncbi:MAG: DUF465 domain-containing protein [Zetaproteobacteria bacterium]|nr:MAG: DUF465 domain-containing protein [Zetaproteobacteria bacterium]